jgi:single-strand DNA-binding protein
MSIKLPDLNHLTIAGRLTRQGELKYSTGGMEICNSAIANDRYQKDGKKTSFFDIVAFGKTAKILSELLKGAPVIVEGSIQIDEWTTKDGEIRKTLKILANRVMGLEWPDRDGQAKAAPRATAADEPQDPGEEDDMPF